MARLSNVCKAWLESCKSLEQEIFDLQKQMEDRSVQMCRRLGCLPAKCIVRACEDQSREACEMDAL